jgi:diadenosine tetraphosphate (Ap4A) HIT family hydrolase
VPRRHVASWFDLSNEEHGAILELVDRLRRRLDATYAPDGYNLGINDGPAAGQTVMHVHMHVIPRYEGDMKDPRGGVRWVLPGKAAYWKRT